MTFAALGTCLNCDDFLRRSVGGLRHPKARTHGPWVEIVTVPGDHTTSNWQE